MYLMRKYCKYSKFGSAFTPYPYRVIAEYFGRNHATAVFAYRKILDYMEFNKDFRTEMILLEIRVRESLEFKDEISYLDSEIDRLVERRNQLKKIA